MAVAVVKVQPAVLEQSSELMEWKMDVVEAAAGVNPVWQADLGDKATPTKVSKLLHGGVDRILRLKYMAENGCVRACGSARAPPARSSFPAAVERMVCLAVTHLCAT